MEIAVERAPADLRRDGGVRRTRRAAVAPPATISPSGRERDGPLAALVALAEEAIPMREDIALGLEQARARTLTLTDIDEDELARQHSPLMSPLVWDLAHVGQQEDLWLLRGGDAEREGVLPRESTGSTTRSSFARAERVDLPLLSPPQARSFIAEVRDRALDRLGDSRGRFPVPDGRAARAAAHRDDAGHPPTARRRATARCRRPLPPGRSRRRTTPCWSGRRVRARGGRRRRAVLAGQRATGAVVDLPRSASAG